MALLARPAAAPAGVSMIAKGFHRYRTNYLRRKKVFGIK
jgi:hypothetical protein